MLLLPGLVSAQPWKLHCSPEKVYRGGSFTVDLPAHKDYELAILGDGGKMLIISFKPAKADRIGPVLSAKAFAAMNQITISTRTARGSLIQLVDLKPSSGVKTAAKDLYTIFQLRNTTRSRDRLV
ncbi:MAG: hypothetical protein ACREQT_17940 [Candidatus Binataceae bacterium]